MPPWRGLTRRRPTSSRATSTGSSTTKSPTAVSNFFSLISGYCFLKGYFGKFRAGQDIWSHCIHFMKMCWYFAYFQSASGVVYSLVKSGNSCGRITTKKDCEIAARKLGLSDTTAGKPSVPTTRPPYCYHHVTQGGLWFNTEFTSNASCSNERPCLCKSGSGKTQVDAILKHSELTTYQYQTRISSRCVVRAYLNII